MRKMMGDDTSGLKTKIQEFEDENKKATKQFVDVESYQQQKATEEYM